MLKDNYYLLQFRSYFQATISICYDNIVLIRVIAINVIGS